MARFFELIFKPFKVIEERENFQPLKHNHVLQSLNRVVVQNEFEATYCAMSLNQQTAKIQYTLENVQSRFYPFHDEK